MTTTHSRTAPTDSQLAEAVYRSAVPLIVDEQVTAWAARRFKVSSDPTRLAMLARLTADTEPLCVCHLTERFNLERPTISHDLKVLRQAGLVTARRSGSWILLRAAPHCPRLGRPDARRTAALTGEGSLWAETVKGEWATLARPDRPASRRDGDADVPALSEPVDQEGRPPRARSPALPLPHLPAPLHRPGRRPFTGHRWPRDVIALAVHWYTSFRLSASNVADLLAERGVDVSARTELTWVHTSGPLLAAAARRRARPLGRRWWCDETYLYRAIDESPFDNGLDNLSHAIDDRLGLAHWHGIG